MGLIKTSLLSGIGVITKIFAMFVMNKILAIYVGPAGYAALGQFQNFVQVVMTAASGGLNSGVTKYTAEYKDDEKRQHIVWSTSSAIALIGTLVMTSFVAIFQKSLARLFFDDESLASIFIWFSSSLFLFVFNALFLAILNGRQEVKLYVIANISGSLLSLILVSILTVNYELYGAVVALATYQAAAFFVTLLLINGRPWFQFRYLFKGINIPQAKTFGKYSAMTIAAVICTPVSHIYVRGFLGDTLGWDVAGYWEAMWRLSSAYLMLFTTTLSVYYLPRFSELSDRLEIHKELVYGFKWIMPAVIFSASIIYVMRSFLVTTLFSDAFREMEVMFAWQMLGDVIKIGSWILSYLMLSKAMYKEFILAEIFFSLSFIAYSHFFVNLYGLEGMAIAHALNYFTYFIAITFVMKKYIFRDPRI